MLKRSKLTIRQEHIQQFIDHALQGLPDEVCGLIGGKDSTAEIVLPVANCSATPRVAFELDHRAMIEAIMAFQQEGREVVAIYHSHPQGEAIPSARDIAEATWPDAVYIIVGLAEPQSPTIRAWQIAYGKSEPVDLIVIAS